MFEAVRSPLGRIRLITGDGVTTLLMPFLIKRAGVYSTYRGEEVKPRLESSYREEIERKEEKAYGI